MGFLERWRRKNRQYWFVCYNCMMQTSHDALNSIFYSEGEKTLILGRPWMPCPRCHSTNTKSFQELKDEGSDNALWGLERIARKYPRSHFEIQPTTAQLHTEGCDAPNNQKLVDAGLKR
jgi:hypothetical protein